MGLINPFPEWPQSEPPRNEWKRCPYEYAHEGLTAMHERVLHG